MPLTQSLYVPGKVKEADKVLIDIGRCSVEQGLCIAYKLYRPIQFNSMGSSFHTPYDTGTGYFVEKTLPQAKDYLDKKVSQCAHGGYIHTYIHTIAPGDRRLTPPPSCAHTTTDGRGVTERGLGAAGAGAKGAGAADGLGGHAAAHHVDEPAAGEEVSGATARNV